MHTTNKIGWQKYEDVIQSQLDSPLLNSLYKKFINPQDNDWDDDSEDQEDDEGGANYSLSFDQRFMENVSLASNFDCWMGYTNFNITEDVLERLEKTKGVEILKVCSRYRFFIGIGKMFDFAEVRQDIEKNLAQETQGESIEQER